MNTFTGQGTDPGGWIDRLWQKDKTLWKSAFASGDDPGKWLGWLDAVEWMREQIGPLSVWADEICKCGRYDHAALLGMGGASLAATVFSGLFTSRPGFLPLTVVDTTSPAQINALDFDPARTLFVVSSKSGRTLETNDLLAWFYEQAGREDKNAGGRFVAITDAGSPLARKASQSGFCRVFLNPVDIGGRYSALSFFGLVPAALIGVDLRLLLENLISFCARVKSGEDTTVTALARLLGDSALSGKRRMRLDIAEPLAPLGAWIEQLIAESTGKNGVGLIPLHGETGGACDRKEAGPEGGFTINIAAGFARCEDVAHADLSWSLNEPCDIAREFFRWQMAATLATVIMDINPFDQPDVEQAKSSARTLVDEKRSVGLRALMENDFCIFYTRDAGLAAPAGNRLADVFEQFQSGLAAAEYLGITAWLPAFTAVVENLQQIRTQLSRSLQLPTTLGFGPRYLHSTGQLHKGGPASGCFIQITESKLEALPIPGRQYGFHDLHRAQADSDYLVLANKARPIMRIALKGDRLEALRRLREGLAEIAAPDLPELSGLQTPCSHSSS